MPPSVFRIRPDSGNRVRCGAARCCTSQQRNTHSTESREVRYRWHPWFGRLVWVHCTRIRQGQGVVRCSLTPELDARAIEIPLWMFDNGVCYLMGMADEPVVCVEALRELNALLRHASRASEVAGQVLQVAHRDLSLAGGAHAIDSEAATPADDATDAVPADSQRAELGSRSDRTPTAGGASARSHASRTPRSPGPGGGAGGRRQ